MEPQRARMPEPSDMALAAEAAAVTQARLYIERFGIGRLQLWLDMHVSPRAPLLPFVIDASRCASLVCGRT